MEKTIGPGAVRLVVLEVSGGGRAGRLKTKAGGPVRFGP